ncbi:Hint domain-containing protein [Aestuariicoccus sp. MJ-SS9]|uniref:Hint domain-containing protein n=1 Tax=Aestuariicoccus sp. MJ-SS9 TaxID=3079855 RepID=UPI00290A3B62|nr:Hint domain-containing protein [Aestuariicoccus sp. MJ-SS9]MDU8910576.1 Hint domain-containing protein [Aestuariicoccus sp. MJ-SS9]
MDSSQRPSQSVTVFRSAHLRVINGANLGDGMSFAEELTLDDIYHLSPVADPARLSLVTTSASPFRIAEDSEIGTPGADLHLDCCVTLMSGNGQTTEALILVETDTEGHAAEVFVLPLAPMAAKTDYVLVGVNPDNALQKFAQIACVSFTRGTLITMASGAQRKVEDLAVGDRVLTRDDGPQEIRWIGHTTTRAVGAFAPIVITKGTLNNDTDLVVSPDHRLFIYQRKDHLGAGRSELLVKARHLVNGASVYRQVGGFVDYFQMLFDHHQIIYAAGIAAESMLVDTRTRAALPHEVEEKLASLIPGHRASSQSEFDAPEALLARPDIADLLRRSSMG